MIINETINIEFSDSVVPAKLQFAKYVAGGTALRLIIASGVDAGQAMDGSVYVEGAFMPNNDYAAFRDYDYNRYVYQSLIKAGVIETDPMTFTRTGFVTIPIHRFTDDALAIRDAQFDAQTN